MCWNNNKLKLKSNETWKNLLNSGSKKFKDTKKIVILDCDGIISTNESFYSKDGKVMKSYGCYDTEMLHFCHNNINWDFIFVSADKKGYDITNKRVNTDLHYNLYNYNGKERCELVNKYKNEGYITLFIGDSLSDIDSCSAADFSATVNTAPQLVKSYCDYISDKNGGYGALADILYNMCLGNSFIEKSLEYI